MRVFFRGLAAAFLLIFLVVAYCALSSRGARPRPAVLCLVESDSIPADCLYIDLLVRKADLSELYIGFNRANGEKYRIASTSDIAMYDRDDFVSFSFHCINAMSDLAIQPIHIAKTEHEFGGDYNDREIEMLLSRLKKICFAYISADGEVLAITNKIVTQRFSSLFWQPEGYLIEGELLKTYGFAPSIYMIFSAPFFAIMAIALYVVSFSKRFIAHNAMPIDLAKGD